MVSGKSDIIDIAAVQRAETDKAYGVDAGMVSLKTGEPVLTWLPKSQVENNRDGTFAIPEWLAKEKGLI